MLQCRVDAWGVLVDVPVSRGELKAESRANLNKRRTISSLGQLSAVRRVVAGVNDYYFANDHRQASRLLLHLCTERLSPR